MTATLESLSPERFRTCRAELIELLRVVVDGGASVNFIAPLDEATAKAYWSEVERQLEAGGRIVLGAFEQGRLVGSVQLVPAPQPNDRHRAEVQKLLVHPAARGRGTGRALMAAIEQAAREAGRTLLVLDTERGSVAEGLYERIGYLRAGVIPRFAMNFDGSALIDTVVFYRHL